MDPRQLYVDERLTGFCVHCGGAPETGDHCPSKVFLDEPFPTDLPIVAACESCNQSFSKDEQYVACFIETAICGSAEAHAVSRTKVSRILHENRSLAARIRDSKRFDLLGNVIWEPDQHRLRNVVLKLARGHIAYELSLLKFDEPEHVAFAPMAEMSETERKTFESPEDRQRCFFPEVGSRAFIRTLDRDHSGWLVVQRGRYRYMIGQSDCDFVQIVLSEYLACRVEWKG